MLTYLTNRLFIGQVWMIVSNSLQKEQLEIHLGCKRNTKKELWEYELVKTKNQEISFISILIHSKFIFKKIFLDLKGEVSLLLYYNVKVTGKVRKRRKLEWECKICKKNILKLSAIVVCGKKQQILFGTFHKSPSSILTLFSF